MYVIALNRQTAKKTSQIFNASAFLYRFALWKVLQVINEVIDGFAPINIHLSDFY